MELFPCGIPKMSSLCPKHGSLVECEAYMKALRGRPDSSSASEKKAEAKVSGKKKEHFPHALEIEDEGKEK